MPERNTHHGLQASSGRIERGRTMRRIFATRRRKVFAAIFTSVLVAGAGFAAWTVITSSGSGAGKTGSLAAPTITNGTVLVADTFPSSPAGSFNPTGTLTMTIDNPNAGALTLTGFSIDDDAVVGGNAQCDFAGAAGRNATNLFVDGQGSAAQAAPPGVVSGLSIAVPPGSSQVNVPAIIGLTSDTPTECQNQTIQGFSITNATFQTG